MPFELLVALRFLREGRTQSVLILAGVTGGVAVIIFLTQLINQLQATIVDRVMGSQAPVVIRPLEEVTRRVLQPSNEEAVAAVVQPRPQRLRSVDQWEQMASLAAATPGVLAVSPVVSGRLAGRSTHSSSPCGANTRPPCRAVTAAARPGGSSAGVWAVAAEAAKPSSSAATQRAANRPRENGRWGWRL